MLKSGQAIGQGAHVSPALHVVLSPQGAKTGTVTPHVSSEQREIDQGQYVVHAFVVLGDPERPAQLRRGSLRVGVGQIADGSFRHPGLSLGELEREWFDGRLILFEPARGVLDELAVL